LITQTGKEIEKAKQILLKGGLVAIPTETVYGLAANGLDTNAIARIFEAKNRPFFDPLILHTHSLEIAFSFFDNVPSDFIKLAKAFWPGSLTLVGPKKDFIPDLLTAGSPLVAVRIPNHPLTLKLLESIDFPLAAPSANPFGYVSPTSAQHVLDQLENKIDYILDGGISNVGIESTIVGLQNNSIEIWRLGGISVEEIEKILGYSIPIVLHQNSNPNAPGQLDKHYSPRKKINLIDLNNFDFESIKIDFAWLGFGDNPKLPTNCKEVLNLSETGNTTEAAANLYSFIRKLDNNEKISEIFSSFLPHQGLGDAINDRLKRAATK
jgi:L-threonylcarbamoyladenylate synthase